MIFRSPLPVPTSLQEAISELYRADEAAVVRQLSDEADVEGAVRARITGRARALVEAVRAQRFEEGGMDAFMDEYELSSEEGVVLMCLAEALLRIPDADTADKLIRDKIGAADWERHLGRSHSWFVNASTWALMLTGRVLRWQDDKDDDLGGVLGRLVARSGEPVIRQALLQAMRILGRQFVMGRTIGEALDRAKAMEARGYRYSYDMLGEAAHTAEDAQRFLEAYDGAIAAVGAAADRRGPIEAPGLSVKLSALHPRYEFAQRDRVLAELTPRLSALAQHAAEAGIGLTVDAEEADRLDLSLEIFERVADDPATAGWDGFGLAVQAYQKRAPAVIDWLADLARRTERRLMVRLVKGAYWDTEIKRGQERGLDGYPVFTRKVSTDISYIACAKRLFAAGPALYPQFATHNALTVATIEELAGDCTDFEYQRLHGMGEALYEAVLPTDEAARSCRIYAPVGSHEELLPYLVRRLLENGANTSFVNRIVDESLPIDDLIRSPVTELRKLQSIPHPRIPLPRDIFGEARQNSPGLDLSDPAVLRPLADAMAAAERGAWRAGPIFAGKAIEREGEPVTSPADRRLRIGTVANASAEEVAMAVGSARDAQPAWDGLGGNARADMLETVALLLETHTAELIAVCVREAGRTIPDALGEVREAADFCRYYAANARRDFGGAETLTGPTGEDNRFSLHGRGVFATISPWNFPIAIFTGQIAAALAAGNTVVAKPAEQTPLTAARVVRLFLEAGVPGEVLHLTPGLGESVGQALIDDRRVAGAAFTGSTETARAINRAFAAREGPIPTLIAETGGQNAMIVDSSALLEQVVVDVLQSAFNSAGQRCSALRVLFIQKDVADRAIRMLSGAMAELRIGDPAFLDTDVGPVIDDSARELLKTHAERMGREARLLFECPLGPEHEQGTFFAPRAFEIEAMSVLDREVFGPILHVVRYSADRLDAVIEAVNATGYGLTLGIHSRIETTIDYITARVRVGNTYVNRNMIGAVVGVQPFGGEGLSGTGPKAGGPHYLARFANERAIAVDTTASGGNAALMTLV